jgi:hypothetical protein
MVSRAMAGADTAAMLTASAAVVRAVFNFITCVSIFTLCTGFVSPMGEQ